MELPRFMKISFLMHRYSQKSARRGQLKFEFVRVNSVKYSVVYISLIALDFGFGETATRPSRSSEARVAASSFCRRPSDLFRLFCSGAAYLSCGCDLQRADPHLLQLLTEAHAAFADKRRNIFWTRHVFKLFALSSPA